jgi:hypothetical protein
VLLSTDTTEVTFIQSFKNLNTLRSFITLREGNIAIFEFLSECEFRLQILDQVFESSLSGQFYSEMLDSDLPYGQIFWDEDGRQILNYTDQLASYYCDTITGQLIDYSANTGWRKRSEVEANFKIDQESIVVPKETSN